MPSTSVCHQADSSFRFMASLVEMERELSIERTRIGLDVARQHGRKAKMTDSRIASAKKLLASGVPLVLDKPCSRHDSRHHQVEALARERCCSKMRSRIKPSRLKNIVRASALCVSPLFSAACPRRRSSTLCRQSKMYSVRSDARQLMQCHGQAVLACA